MHGWDFSVLKGRMTSARPDWDFEAECRDALSALADAGGGTVLDMGTGGGERLAPGGILVCEQVDGTDAPETHDWFGTRPAYPGVRPAVMADALRGAGLDVEEPEQWSGPMDFTDVDALVAYWALVPWDVPEDFTVPGYAAVLERIHRESGGGGPVRLTARRFRLRARRPL